MKSILIHLDENSFNYIHEIGLDEASLEMVRSLVRRICLAKYD